MGDIRQQLNLYISGIRDTALMPPDVMKRAAQLVGQMAVEANREMILDNKKKTGGELPAPSELYKARKAKMIRGKLPKGYPRKTIFAAKTADDRGRLSGRLVSDITYANAKFVKGDNDVDLFVDLVVKGERSNKIFGYLRGKGFEGMIGLPNPNTNKGRQVRQEMIAAVKRLLAINARAKGVVLEDSIGG